jgi:hypothetical protein
MFERIVAATHRIFDAAQHISCDLASRAPSLAGKPPQSEPLAANTTRMTCSRKSDRSKRGRIAGLAPFEGLNQTKLDRIMGQARSAHHEGPDGLPAGAGSAFFLSLDG